jgi:hypothetical protein
MPANLASIGDATRQRCAPGAGGAPQGGALRTLEVTTPGIGPTLSGVV